MIWNIVVYFLVKAVVVTKAEEVKEVCPPVPPFDADFCSIALFAVGCWTDNDCTDKDMICCPVGKCHVADCVKPLRPEIVGTCPALPPFDAEFCSRASFAVGCWTDNDCTNKGMICCGVGICHVADCVKPLREKLPGCPVNNATCDEFKQRCKINSDCDKGEQCCYNPTCGTLCQPDQTEIVGRVCPPLPPFDAEFCSRATFPVGCWTDNDCTNKGMICCPAGTCHVADCVKPQRPEIVGTCPALPPFDAEFCSRATFLVGCWTDNDCADKGMICCAGGMCHVADCVKPLREEIPGCPVNNATCGEFKQRCKRDSYCDKGEQCCYNPTCGTLCQPSDDQVFPTDDENK